jgi:hypothetical protein
MSPGQWDPTLATAYEEGWILLEINEDEAPVAAYQKKAVTPIDTTNKFLVGAAGDGSSVTIFQWQLVRLMTLQDALLLAAYLVAIVGDDEQWQKTLKAVQET